MVMERCNNEPMIWVPSKVENAKTMLDLCKLFEDKEGFAKVYEELVETTLEEIERSRNLENIPEGSRHEDNSI